VIPEHFSILTSKLLANWLSAASLPRLGVLISSFFEVPNKEECVYRFISRNYDHKGVF
jgi:hypothetical protein